MKDIGICPYCYAKVVLITNDKIYGKRYGSGWCYKCTKCDAYVGCHDNKEHTPLGRLANAELRKLKQKAHSLFEPIWQNGDTGRNDLYKQLAFLMNIPKEKCHFGYFDKATIEKSISIMQSGILDRT